MPPRRGQRCRSSACRSRSRTTSTSPACATTAGCPQFRYVPEAHAGAVERLIAAGAVCVGKTNLDQFATGLVGTRSPYGRPSSTFAPERISGGSSSGSAVAVSRGDVPFALGTDTAGSGRVPAAFNHIVGLKPTPGRVSTRGVVPACRSIDCVSVLALTVDDAALVLSVIEGPDAADPFSAFALGPARYGEALRIGVPSQVVFHGDAGYGPAYEQAVAHVQRLGHRIVALDFTPLHAVAELLYGGAVGGRALRGDRSAARARPRGDRPGRSHRHRRGAHHERDRCLPRPLRAARGAARHAPRSGTRSTS